MRITRTWTISLPPEMSELALAVAKLEQRTKSELIRESLRLYLSQRGEPMASGASERLRRVGELASLYRRRHATRQPSEAELRRSFRGVRRMHERLKHLSG
jgi:CopG family transcriptional regulator/antitoxin EndoAI